MYEIHGFAFSSNTRKVLYVAEELGIDYKYTDYDPSKGEHKNPDQLKRHPLGKTPTLDHDGKYLFESGAICRYLASVENQELYPVQDHYQRCLVDQWLDFFTIHLGRWLNTLLFERAWRKSFGMGETNTENVNEALGFIEQQMACVDKHLSENSYFLGDSLSIADLFAFAYMETIEISQLSLDPYPHVKKWYEQLKDRPSVQAAQKKTDNPDFFRP